MRCKEKDVEITLITTQPKTKTQQWQEALSGCWNAILNCCQKTRTNEDITESAALSTNPATSQETPEHQARKTGSAPLTPTKSPEHQECPQFTNTPNTLGLTKPTAQKKSDKTTTTINNIIFHAPQPLDRLKKYLDKQTDKCYVVILTQNQLKNESELSRYHEIDRSLQRKDDEEFTKTEIEQLYEQIQRQKSKNPINVVCCCDLAIIRSQVVNAALQLHAISNCKNPPDPKKVLDNYMERNRTAHENLDVPLTMMGFLDI